MKGAYNAFKDRTLSLLDRWERFYNSHQETEDIDRKCIKGFLYEVDDSYVKYLTGEHPDPRD